MLLWTNGARCSSVAALNPSSVASKKPLGSVSELGAPRLQREHRAWEQLCNNHSCVDGAPAALPVICAAVPRRVLDKSLSIGLPLFSFLCKPGRRIQGRTSEKQKKVMFFILLPLVSVSISSPQFTPRRRLYLSPLGGGQLPQGLLSSRVSSHQAKRPGLQRSSGQGLGGACTG